MIQYTIWTENYAELFQIKLNKLLEDPDHSCGTWQSSSLEFIKCFKCTLNKDEQEGVLKNIVNLVGDVIQEGILKKFVKRYLRYNKELSWSEKKEVERLFMYNSYMSREEGVSYIAYYVLYAPLFKELETYKEVNIDGWISFRTQKYKVILEDMMEQVLYDYKMQKDYIQFMNFLLETKLMQQAKENVIHLVPEEEGEIILFDETMKNRTDEYIKQYCSELTEKETKIEDKVLHILVSVCPKKITIHQGSHHLNPSFLDTLRVLFKDQLTFCQGCKICEKSV